MEIYIKQEDIKNNIETVTYQNPFPTKALCKKCRVKEALPIMLINDISKEICNQRPKGVRVWPHDSTAIVLYLCTECGNMTADWNQG